MEQTDDPLATFALRDVRTGSLVFHEELPISRVADGLFNFFHRHYQEFASESPKDFVFYVKVDGKFINEASAKLWQRESINGSGRDEEVWPFDLILGELERIRNPPGFPEKSQVTYTANFIDEERRRFRWERVET